jgi:ribosome biogenesis GTPase
MPQGIIIKGIGGFYYVKQGGTVVECKARGRFRNQSIVPLVGDIVDAIYKDGGWVIDSIKPRSTELIRPPIANVNHVVVVFSSKRPEPNFNLLDRFLLMAEYTGLDITICINKIDLSVKPEMDIMSQPYRDAGYNVVYSSTKSGEGIEALRTILMGRITVFAGPSGVGKSSILNALHPSFSMKTGELSSKLDRGKHTTRHTELLELDGGGFVADTPGFSSIDISHITKEELEVLFPEFSDLINKCHFQGCSHISEPDCAIKKAVLDKKINENRYKTYIEMYQDIKKGRRDKK